MMEMIEKMPWWLRVIAYMLYCVVGSFLTIAGMCAGFAAWGKLCEKFNW